ncbi:ABC transporter substrate-binding protein [Halomicrococcus sp. SG-WS-1]|uniref:ABC transporter substrate-binding protein n=1 Tax=Halomicrococcus sp. SG-WS-1 TaxID=3439057 RepID=UPI003F790DB0
MTDIPHASTNTRRRFLKTAGAASATVSITGCISSNFGGSGGDNGSTSKLKIGLTRSSSGDYSFASKMGFRGLKLWKNRVNKNGGIKTPDGKKKIKLVYYDDRSNKQRVLRLYKKLLNEDNVDVVFGPFGSTLTAAAASVVNSKNKFLLSWSAASPEIFEQGYDNIVSVNPTAPQITKGEIMGMSSAGVKDLAVIHLNKEFPTSQAEGIKRYAKENNINIVHMESFPSSQSDFSSTLNSIKSKNPDAFYPVAYTDTLVNIANQMKASNVMFPWTSMTYAADPAFHKALGKDAKYFFGHSIYHPDFNYDVTGGLSPKKFYKEFKNAYDDQTPSYIGSLGYAGGYMLGRFAEKADSLTTEGLKKAAVDLSGDVTTITGNYKIKENGVQTGFLYTATQNKSTSGELYDKLEVVAPDEAATGKPKYPIPGWDER